MRKVRSYKYYIRKAHRYLGIFIGVQFLLWTIGGLYFSWTNIKEIRGEDLRKEHQMLQVKGDLIAPQNLLEKVKIVKGDVMVLSLRLIDILGESFYELKTEDETFVINAASGEFRSEISENEAKRLAIDSLKQAPAVKSVEFLTKENVGGHHEYREKPLPAWAVRFDSSNDLTVYLSAQTGQIGAFRTNKWRIFDFLWMFHTMDFVERDNINNYVLRAFSALGIVTLLSGFALFAISSRSIRRFIRI